MFHLGEKTLFSLTHTHTQNPHQEQKNVRITPDIFKQYETATRLVISYFLVMLSDIYLYLSIGLHNNDLRQSFIYLLCHF